LEANNTWSLIPSHLGKQPISFRWVYKIKRYSDGLLEHYKASLVAKSYTQLKCIDYHDTFSHHVVDPFINLMFTMLSFTVISMKASICLYLLIFPDRKRTLYVSQKVFVWFKISFSSMVCQVLYIYWSCWFCSIQSWLFIIHISKRKIFCSFVDTLKKFL
jgi:hypothetical protein